MTLFKEKQKTLFIRKKKLIENATESEKHIYSILEKAKIKFVFQKGFIQGNNYCIVDFYFPKPMKTCLEIDGEYHLSEKQKKRDKNRDQYLTSRKLRVARITNKEALNCKWIGELMSLLVLRTCIKKNT